MIESAPLQLPHYVFLERRKEMNRQLVALALLLVVSSASIGQVSTNSYSDFEYVYATAGSSDIRVVNVKFKDSKGIRLEVEHLVDFTRNNSPRTLTLTSGYMRGSSHSITFTAHQGY